MVIDQRRNILEAFSQNVDHRGMQFQVFGMSRLVRERATSVLMPPSETVSTMETLDEIGRQIGLTFSGEGSHAEAVLSRVKTACASDRLCSSASTTSRWTVRGEITT